MTSEDGSFSNFCDNKNQYFYKLYIFTLAYIQQEQLDGNDIREQRVEENYTYFLVTGQKGQSSVTSGWPVLGKGHRKKVQTMDDMAITRGSLVVTNVP